jgi:hypothetical protein
LTIARYGRPQGGGHKTPTTSGVQRYTAIIAGGLRIRAVELLAKLDREDREFAALTAVTHDPLQELREIAKTPP